MLVVPFACAEFHDKSGNIICRIHAHELRTITEVPEAIKQDPLYALMVEEGSLKAPESRLDLRALENDPEAKLGKPVKAAKTAKAEKTPKTEKPEKAETESSSAAPAEAAASDGIQAGKKA